MGFGKDMPKIILELFQIHLFLIIFLFHPFIVGGLLIYLAFTPYWWASLLYIVWTWYQWGAEVHYVKPWEWMRNHRFWDHVSGYFPLTIVKTAELPPGHNYILAWHPHGIVSIAAVVAMCSDGARFTEKFPGITRHLSTLTSQFNVPLRRPILSAFGVIPASFGFINRLFASSPRGNAVCLVVGGAEEALESHSNVYRLCLKERKGFCRMALISGAHIVPVYAFGETGGYNQAWNPVGSSLRAFQAKMKKLIGFSLVIPYGREIFPGIPSITPFQGEIVAVFGQPIPITKTDNPTQEQVNQLHSLYKSKLIELFETHKTKYGVPSNAQLEFY
ncbi:unnamed protein product [Bursaphelenchus xylophilus]|uniref:Acyltransferase n=1 Tax=Bursaphelenchus xylophilus TaxID=6326 RepID=A0A1I7S530_BURXY|nr:unnamed protein product [Bursaphelenchus xylophilus]CAG9117642.1 unnamed protein product [Bursaphelenchus xylophilus]